MKKIGIVTIVDNSNYGNRLQNYALQEFMMKYGFECETIYFKENLANRAKTKIKNVIKFCLPVWHTKRLKEIKFKRFNKKHINIVGRKDKELNKLKNNYNYFIVGSDQVWNYTYMVGLERYFLPYADYNQAISYAASFGVSSIKEDFKEIIKNGINNIKYLSVREERGKELIKELTGREAQVLVDPTLLISRDDWEKIEKAPRKFKNKKYILVYFLGENQYEREIKEIARENKLDVIDIANINETKYYSLDPSEFIYLFNHAEMVYTDSFHACVFSMIFNKPFFVFDRKQQGVESMNSRLDTLLKMFNQENRKIEVVKNNKEIFECDYLKVEEILEKEREKTKKFFKEIFDRKNFN